MIKKKSNLEKEAQAFDKRISKRSKNGFIADLRNLKFCNYFYKSFWRHPDFANLYVGEMSKYYINFFKKNLKKNDKILDLGCGPGYFSLELARAGFEVLGLDISKKALDHANFALKNNKKNRYLKLKYKHSSLENLKIDEKFDGVLSSGFLHHVKNLKKTSKLIKKILKKNGVLLIYEPQHEEWNKSDALLVLFLRHILKELNMWYDKDLKIPINLKNFNTQLNNIQNEYLYERDPHEKGGQSPNDLSSNKFEIIKALKKDFSMIDIKPGFSFIYRFLGGLRGDQQKLKKLSKLIALLERHSIDKGILNANYFYASFRK